MRLKPLAPISRAGSKPKPRRWASVSSMATSSDLLQVLHVRSMATALKSLPKEEGRGEGEKIKSRAIGSAEVKPCLYVAPE
jgi:hypothetical protein